MKSKSEFQPYWILKNAHMQTMFATLFKSYLPTLPQYRIEIVELNDGDYVELIWPDHQINSDAPLVILLHGLGGNVHSSYVSVLFDALKNAGLRSVLMHFRGSGEQTNRLPRMYNAGDTKDLDHVVSMLVVREPKVAKAIIGISLGGNVLLKWLGEQGRNAKIEKAIAISVPYDLETLVDHLDSQLINIYQNHLLNKLKNLYNKKLDGDLFIKRDEIQKINLIRDFDDRLTAPLAGFKNAHEYYQHSSCLPFLKNIAVNTLLIHAQDDPFMPPTSVPNEEILSDKIHLELSPYGGHVGFIYNEKHFKPGFWLAKRVPEYLIDLHRGR